MKPKKTKIEETVVGAYQKIEDTVVGTYQKIEDAVVGTYQKIEDKFVEKFLEEIDKEHKHNEIAKTCTKDGSYEFHCKNYELCGLDYHT